MTKLEEVRQEAVHSKTTEELAFELLGLDMDDLDAFIEEESDHDKTLNLLRFRNMMFALKIKIDKEEEAKKVFNMVKKEWSGVMKTHKDGIESLREYMKTFILEKNKGEPVKNDAGSFSVRKLPPKIHLKGVEAKENLIESLKLTDSLEGFLDEPVFNEKKYIDGLILHMKEQAEEFVEQLVQADTEVFYSKAKKAALVKEKHEEFLEEYIKSDSNLYLDIEFPGYSPTFRK